MQKLYYLWWNICIRQLSQFVSLRVCIIFMGKHQMRWLRIHKTFFFLILCPICMFTYEESCTIKKRWQYLRVTLSCLFFHYNNAYNEASEIKYLLVSSFWAAVTDIILTDSQIFKDAYHIATYSQDLINKGSYQTSQKRINLTIILLIWLKNINL